MNPAKNMRVVLAGPESTGKSALTAHLAARFQAPFALEYARWYLETHGLHYTYDLLLEMSRGHKAHQEMHVPPDAAIGIFDTDLLNYKIWCEVAYGRCHPEILAGVETEDAHVYLLCYPDIPWEADPLREHRDGREMLFDRHVREIERLGRDYVVITGEGLTRRNHAEAACLRLGVSPKIP